MALAIEKKASKTWDLVKGLSNMKSQRTSSANSTKQLKSFKIFKEVPEYFLEEIQIATIKGLVGAIVVTKNDEVFAVATEVTKFLGYNPGSGTANRTFRLNHLCNRGIIGIAMGPSHFAAWTDSGEVWVWGANESGQLGVGHAKPLERPEVVGGELKRVFVVKVACGTGHTLCLSDDGKVYAMGSNGYYQIAAGIGTKTVLLPFEVQGFSKATFVTDVVCGPNSSFAVTKDGSVLAWGYNTSGQAGTGIADDGSFVDPVRLPTKVAINGKVIKVVCGLTHCVALTETNEVYAWGTENAVLRRNPEKLQFEPDRVEDVATNGSTNFCKEAGKVVVWGSGWEGNYITFAERKVTQFLSIEEAIASKDMSTSESMRFLNDTRATQQDLRSVFNQPNLWDLEFKVEEKLLKASKHLLVVRCDYFAKMVSGAWKEVISKGPIKIDDFGYDEFKTFLRFIHTDRFILSSNSNCDALIGMLKLADYYGCPLLQAKVTEALATKIDEATAIMIYSASLRFNAKGARLMALDYIAPKYVKCAKATDFSKLEGDCTMQLLIDLQSITMFQ